MNLSDAVEKAQRILVEEQKKPTRSYKYARDTGATAGLTNESLMKLAAHATLMSDRQECPRDVHEDPKEYKFESVNFDLLVKIFHQVQETERPQFMAALLKLVERPFPAQPVSMQSFPSVNGKSSMLPLIAEFCVRTGHLNELLEATKIPKFPTASLAMMVMELEEMVALNFNLFSDLQLEVMPKELATLRANSDLQTYASKGERGKPHLKNPHYKPGFEDMGRLVVKRIDGLSEECRSTVFLP